MFRLFVLNGEVKTSREKLRDSRLLRLASSEFDSLGEKRIRLAQFVDCISDVVCVAVVCAGSGPEFSFVDELIESCCVFEFKLMTQ